MTTTHADAASSRPSPPTTSTTTTRAPRRRRRCCASACCCPQSGDGGDDRPAARRRRRWPRSRPINAAGGVLGRPVEVVDVDEGDTPTSARTRSPTSIEHDVDAVVGPASSTIALATLDDLMSAGILTCSPTATALALDDFPDRSCSSARRRATRCRPPRIAQHAEQTGRRRSAVAYLDDRLRPSAAPRPRSSALRAPGPRRRVEVRFAGRRRESLLDEATEIVSSDAGVVIVLADAEQGTPHARQPSARPSATASDERPPDDHRQRRHARRPPHPARAGRCRSDVRERDHRAVPARLRHPRRRAARRRSPPTPTTASTSSPSPPSQAEQRRPAADRRRIVDVSDGGVPCRTFAECAEPSTERNIDYDGPGGRRADRRRAAIPVAARFDRFGFDEQGSTCPSRRCRRAAVAGS